ncbi:MAG: DUF4399 domain-containing protein [Myxococcaceae bacterium]
MKYFVLLALLLASCQKKTDSEVYFVNLSDNAKVPSTFLVQFGVRGMQIKPAGQDIENRHAGHHHLLIDNLAGEIPEGQVVPMDPKNIHYGKGQTEGVLELSPGKHTLTLQFADGAHRSYGKKFAKTITVFTASN